eukprot:TRINITY_DN3599_c0_g1_i2.p1 TRINITY_DN3599_c0_g1~~TRINITY_DN3599_c0_g1_i2.p1  ORF type:complete len:926 (+),score=124.19 TRINITY_DN3599_c0_g1_i2:141-2918(+)
MVTGHAAMPPSLHSFPATRSILWDRTPRGSRHRLSIDSWQPQLSISTSAVAELVQRVTSVDIGDRVVLTVLARRVSSNESRHIEFRHNSWMCLAASQIVSGSDGWDSSHVAICVHLLSHESTSSCVERGSSLQHAWRGEDLQPVNVAGCYLSQSAARELHRLLDESSGAARIEAARNDERPKKTKPEAFLKWVGVASSDLATGTLQLWLASVYPRWAFRVIALARPLRTLDTPLLQALLTRSHTSWDQDDYGFLTLDLGRRVVCLLEGEELVERVPLVGVWVDLADETLTSSGVSEHPSLWAAAARYMHRRRVERVWVEDSTFLLMVAHQGGLESTNQNGAARSLSFFEASLERTESQALYLASLDHQKVRSDADAPWIHLRTFAAELHDLAHVGERRPENPEVVIPHSDVRQVEEQGFSPECSLVQLNSGDFHRLVWQAEGRGFDHECPLLRLGIGDSQSGSFKVESPRARVPEPHPRPANSKLRDNCEAELMASLSDSSQPHSAYIPADIQVPTPSFRGLGSCAAKSCFASDHALVHEPVSIPEMSAGSASQQTLGVVASLPTESDTCMMSTTNAASQPVGAVASQPNRTHAFVMPAGNPVQQLSGVVVGQSTKRDTDAGAAAEAGGHEHETASLHTLVGQQQEQLRALQEQLSNMHKLFASVLGSDGLLPSTRVCQVSAGACKRASTPISSESQVQRSSAVQTSPPLLSRDLEIHKEFAAPTFRHASVNVGASLEFHDLMQTKRETMVQSSSEMVVTSQTSCPSVASACENASFDTRAGIWVLKSERDVLRQNALPAANPDDMVLTSDRDVFRSSGGLLSEVGSTCGSMDDSWRLVVPGMPDARSAPRATQLAEGLRDSADTAGGATPRMLSQNNSPSSAARVTQGMNWTLKQHIAPERHGTQEESKPGGHTADHMSLEPLW